MHPAISVIFFTVASGAGFGFIALVGLGWPMRDDPVSAFLACVLGGGLAVAGLVSSTFHLGHPERAWRALSQWRSSWLSREGVLAIATLLLLGGYTITWLAIGSRPFAAGILLAALSVATVYSTAMIYASLKTVPLWHQALTPACYLAYSLASGLLLAIALGNIPPDGRILPTGLAVAALFVAWGIKVLWWRQTTLPGIGLRGTDAGTATGLGSIGTVRLLERPHTGENYLTKEMVHKLGRKHARVLRSIAVLAGLAMPAALLLLYAGGMPQLLPWLAFASLMAGLFVERWLFFAQAKHSVSLYY